MASPFHGASPRAQTAASRSLDVPQQRLRSPLPPLETAPAPRRAEVLVTREAVAVARAPPLGSAGDAARLSGVVPLVGVRRTGPVVEEPARRGLLRPPSETACRGKMVRGPIRTSVSRLTAG